MTRKQIKKYAEKFAELEQLHNTAIDQADVAKYEKEMMALTLKIASGPDGLEIMEQIDEYIQEHLM